MKVFFLSGLGTDKRVFRHIQLPEGFEAVYIYWQLAFSDESIEEYTYKLFSCYEGKFPYIVIGFSLGGIMAAEIAQDFSPLCTVLIGSVPVSDQLPPYYRIASKLKMHRILPPILWKITATCKQFLTLRSREDRRLMRRITWDSEDSFTRWGIKTVLSWRNEVFPRPFYQIHGTRDEIFPIRYTDPTHIIPGGGHLLVMTHPKEVNAILREILMPYRVHENP